MKITIGVRQTIVYLLLGGSTVLWAESRIYGPNDRARDDANNLWMEKAVKQGMDAANQAMLQIALDPQQNPYGRATAVEKLRGPGGVGARQLLRRIADSITEEQKGNEGWRLLESETLDTVEALAYYEAKTPEGQYTVLTNLVDGSTRFFAWELDWAMQMLTERGDDRDWPVIERVYTVNSDDLKLARELFLLAQLAKRDPAAYTNTLREIAAVRLLPRKTWFRDEKDREAHEQVKAQAAKRAEPHLKKVGQKGKTLSLLAYEKLVWPPERQHFETLQRLLEKGVLTTNDVRQCTVPEIKEVVDSYILGTNRPPWQVTAP